MYFLSHPTSHMDPIFLAYTALISMALVPIYFGSKLTLKHSINPKTAPEDREFFSFEDAKMFPILGSATLFSLYLIFKYVDKSILDVLIAVYFGFLGVSALTNGLLVGLHAVTGSEFKGDYKLEMTHKRKLNFGVVHVAVAAVAIVITAVYSYSKHWLLSNLYGEAFSLSAISLLNLDSFKAGIVLLSGLFFYDVFWVFGTDVMVTVAKSFDAPIKVIFPRNVFQWIENGFLSNPTNMTMLGLGDIVIPGTLFTNKGIFVALCLQFDHHLYKIGRNKTFTKPYFTCCFVAYFLGLVTTVVVMHVFKAAQPALLYLSPACILSCLLCAAVRGEISDLFAFSADDDSSSGSKKKKSSEKAEKLKVEDEELVYETRDVDGPAASAGKRRKSTRLNQ